MFRQQRLSLDGRFDDLLPRKTKTEEGERINEWSTTLEAIRQFLQGQQRAGADVRRRTRLSANVRRRELVEPGSASDVHLK